MKKATSAHDAAQNYSSLEESPWVQYLLLHGRNILYALLALIIAGIIVYQFTATREMQKETDYWTAEKDFRLLLNPSSEMAKNDPVNELKAMIDQHPQLHAKYDGRVAQILINRGELAEAMPFAQSAIARTHAINEPFYSDYAQTTLLIMQGQYDQALANARAMQAKMIEQRKQVEPEQLEFGDTLYALNLLRLGILQQQLGLGDEELKTWQEWKSLSQAKMLYLQQGLFADGRVSLIDYINARESQLKH